MKLLALDQASHVTGYSIFEDETPIKISHFNAKGTDFADRLVSIKQQVDALIKEYNIDTVAIEDIQLQQNKEQTITTEDTQSQKNKIQNVKTFKILAEVLGVLEEYLQETNMKYYVIPPIQWKATLKIAGKGRTAEKAAAQKYVKDTYGLICTEDEADSVGIATHIIKSINSVYDWS